jgi:hypothetical protein
MGAATRTVREEEKKSEGGAASDVLSRGDERWGGQRFMPGLERTTPHRNLQPSMRAEPRSISSPVGPSSSIPWGLFWMPEHREFVSLKQSGNAFIFMNSSCA